MLHSKGLNSSSTFVASHGILANAFDVCFGPNFIASGATRRHEWIAETELVRHGVMARRRRKGCHRDISNTNDYAVADFCSINENRLSDFMTTA
jgi:hypothetical protein